MSDQWQNLIIAFGAVLVASIPIVAMAFGWSQEKTDMVTAQITKIIAALAPLVAAIAALYLANQHSQVQQQQKIEAVKAMKDVAPEHKESRAKYLGMPAN